ncbi:hypothetical protein [Mesorhizobium sp. SP-1A]|uniref:hypothetical protein n=1 Tax=Mesorhizobium sp. SP-1A TaxID=3077840 RepID=UPI0028F6FB61|nr:hypothetical protein [Mesorhizobium sp. SP-1A]
MDFSSWNMRRRLIDKDFRADLEANIECGPFDGGCVIVAQALKAVIGGEIVGLVDKDDTVGHAVVHLDGKLWDYDGPMPSEAFIARFNRLEAPWKCVGYRKFRDTDLELAYRDDELVGRLVELFRRMMPDLARQEVPSSARDEDPQHTDYTPRFGPS